MENTRAKKSEYQSTIVKWGKWVDDLLKSYAEICIIWR